jgi:hypothetical protein
VRGLGKRLREFAHAEWGALVWEVREALVRRRLRAVPLTLGAVGLVGLLQLVQITSWGAGPIAHIGVVRADMPFGQALLRTPLSLFVPALGLPVWGALAQVLVVFGVAEIAVGRLRTLAVAYLATLAGTSYARYALAVGPDGFLGLPTEWVTVRDTGPSAAVAALAVYVAVRHRAWATASAVVVCMAAEAALVPNLAGYEHCAALAAVLPVCLAERLAARRRAQCSVKPPSQS